MTMCLTGNKSWWQITFKLNVKPKIAKKDIIVYKMLRSLGNGVLQSPYQRTRYQIGSLYTVPKLGIIDNSTSTYYSKYFKVNEGIHSFTSLKTARFRKVYHCKIYKCIIPKGAKYLEGVDDEIVSTQLIVEEVV